jgi:hypothetical protein
MTDEQILRGHSGNRELVSPWLLAVKPGEARTKKKRIAAGFPSFGTVTVMGASKSTPVTVS